MRILILTITSLILINGNGQSIKPLRVGDKVPEWVFSSSPIDKSKLIILDFFATWCGSCINTLPKLNELQKKMKDSIQLVVVSTQSGKLINEFRSTNGKIKSVTLPFITGDSILSSLFPYQLLPHEVWIYKGIVKAITESESVNAMNIRHLIISGELDLKVKKDIIGFDKNRSIFEYLENATIIRSSLFTGKLRGAPGLQSSIQTEQQVRWYFVNHPIIRLYKYASGFDYNLFFYDLSDSSLLNFYSSSVPLFSYEQTVPTTTTETQCKKWMLSDLNTQSEIRGFVEKRVSQCYVIKSLSSGVNCLTKGARKKVSLDISKQFQTYTNVPLKRIMEEYTYSGEPSFQLPILIDETKIVENVDIILPVLVLKDITLLNNALLPYGLTITKEERIVERFVISDRKLL